MRKSCPVLCICTTMMTSIETISNATTIARDEVCGHENTANTAENIQHDYLHEI